MGLVTACKQGPSWTCITWFSGHV